MQTNANQKQPPIITKISLIGKLLGFFNKDKSKSRDPISDWERKVEERKRKTTDAKKAWEAKKKEKEALSGSKERVLGQTNVPKAKPTENALSSKQPKETKESADEENSEDSERIEPLKVNSDNNSTVETLIISGGEIIERIFNPAN